MRFPPRIYEGIVRDITAHSGRGRGILFSKGFSKYTRKEYNKRAKIASSLQKALLKFNLLTVKNSQISLKVPTSDEKDQSTKLYILCQYITTSVAISIIPNWFMPF